MVDALSPWPPRAANLTLLLIGPASHSQTERSDVPLPRPLQDWVFELTEPRPSLSDYLELPAEHWEGIEQGNDPALLAQAKRFEKMHRKAKIKEANARSNEL